MRDTIFIVHETSDRSDTAYGAGESSCKWRRPMPGELASLWSMLRFHAFSFVRLLTTIRHWREAYRLGADFVAGGEVQLDDGSRDYLGDLLDELKTECEELDLPLSIQKLDRIKSTLPSIRGNEMVNQFGHLEELITDELKTKLFIAIPTQQAQYFTDSSPLFGKDVESSFPEMSADIEDAGCCLGVERWTAAVYHLMRVMECALVRLTAKLLVVIADIEHKTWGEILVPIDAAVAALPKRTKEQEELSEAAVHLRQVKIAWRDPTMHNRRRYNQTEAEAVFRNVKTFVENLQKVL